MKITDLFRRKREPDDVEQSPPHEREPFRFMTDDEMENYKKRSIYTGKMSGEEMIISERISIPITRNAGKNANIIVIGSTEEAIKSFVIPNILSASTSCVVLDPDGEMFRNFSLYLKEKNYDVEILDADGMRNFSREKEESFRAKRSVLFLKIPSGGDEITAAGEFLSHFILAVINDRNRDNHVSFYFPEFLNIGKISNFESLFCNARLANVSFGLVIDNWEKLHMVYHPAGGNAGAKIFFNTADTMLFLSCDDEAVYEQAGLRMNEIEDKLSGSGCVVVFHGCMSYVDKEYSSEGKIPYRRAMYLLEHSGNNK